MGSDQSCNKRESREHREPAATPRDVQKALEQQRMMYELKMKQLLEETRLAKTTAPPVGQAATAAPPVAPADNLRAAANHQQQAPNDLLERQRHPYSYNQNKLHSPRDLNSGSLYPNLGAGAGCSASPQGTAYPGYTSPNGGYGGVYPAGSSAYQYQQQTPLQPAQRNLPPQPSAPPCETSSTKSRARSQSRQRDSDADAECLTCGNTFGERIYQCNLGHSSCARCKLRQVACARCGLQLTDRRNYDLEKYLLEKKVKCPNSSDGCRLFIKMADVAIHEKECPFKALQCPSLGSCSWRGKLSQLSDHFHEMHPMHNQGEVDKEMFMSNVTQTNHIMHYIKIGTFNFLVHVKVSEAEARMYVAVQLVGTKHSAAKWDYEVHMYNKSQPRRKYQYVDSCSSATEPLQSIISTTKCAVIPLEYAKTFICGGAVAYKFYIKRDDYKRNGTANNNNTEDVRRAPYPRRNYKKFVKKN